MEKSAHWKASRPGHCRSSATAMHAGILLCFALVVFTDGANAPACTPPVLQPRTMSPTSIDISFDNKIRYLNRHVRINASFASAHNVSQWRLHESTGCYSLVLFFGDHAGHDELLERPLPDGIGSMCRQHGGHVVIDDSYDESYALSCCEIATKNCASAADAISSDAGGSFACSFNCPIPPANLVAPDDAATIDRIIGWTVRVHSTSMERHGKWAYLHGKDKSQPVEFRYVPERSELGTVNMIMSISVAAPILIGAVSSTTDRLHGIASNTPYVSFAAHLLTTAMMTVILAYLLALVVASEDTSDRGLLMRAGLIYALISVTFSPLILYTPKPKEQTVHVDKKTLKKWCGEGTLLQCTKWCKKKKVRDVCALIYVLGCALQALAISSIYQTLRQHAAADIELCVSVSIVYIVLVLVYLVAFITAIYDLRPVLRIDYKSGQLVKAYPRSLRAMREEAKEQSLRCHVQTEARRPRTVVPFDGVPPSEAKEPKSKLSKLSNTNSSERGEARRVQHADISDLRCRRKLWLYKHQTGFVDVDRWLKDNAASTESLNTAVKELDTFKINISGRVDRIASAQALDLEDGSIVVLKSLIVSPGIPGDYKKIAENMGLGPICDVCCWTLGAMSENGDKIILFEGEEASKRGLSNGGMGAPRYMCCGSLTERVFGRCCARPCVCCRYQAIGTSVRLPSGDQERQRDLEENSPDLQKQALLKTPQFMALRQPPKTLILGSRNLDQCNSSHQNQPASWCPTSGIVYMVKKYDDSSFRFIAVGELENGEIMRRNNRILNAISFLFALREGDAIDPSVDWRPNLVESMRVQGWLSFETIQCLRGPRCGAFYFSCLGCLALFWWIMILYLLALPDANRSPVAHFVLVSTTLLEFVLVGMLTMFGYIVSTDVDEHEDPMTNPSQKVIKVAYKTYLSGGRITSATLNTLNDSNSHGDLFLQRAQEKLPQPQVRLPSTPRIQPEDNLIVAESKKRVIQTHDRETIPIPRKGPQKIDREIFTNTSGAFEALPETAMKRGSINRRFVQIHPSLTGLIGQKYDAANHTSATPITDNPTQNTVSASDFLNFNVDFKTGTHTVIPTESSSGVAWNAAVSHRDMVNEMYARINDKPVLPEKDLPDVGPFRGVASCNSFPLPQDAVDNFHSKTMATILLRPGPQNELPLFPRDIDIAESTANYSFLFTAEIPCEILDHDDNAMVSFGVGSGNFKCNFYPGTHLGNSFPHDTCAVVAGASIRRYTRDSRKTWEIKSGISIKDPETIQWDEHQYRHAMNLAAEGDKSSPPHLKTFKVGCGVLNRRFFIILPDGAYTFPPIWDQDHLAPGMFDLDCPRGFKLLKQEHIPSQLILSIRCHPDFCENAQNMNIKLAMHRLRSHRLKSILEASNDVYDPWRSSLSPIVDMTILDRKFQVVRSQTMFSSSRIEFTGPLATPRVIFTKENKGHVIHVSTGSQDTENIQGPSSCWATSLKGLASLNSSGHQMKNDGEVKQTEAPSFPNLEHVYNDNSVDPSLAKNISFVVPTCTMSADDNAQYCEFNIDLSRRHWRPEFVAYGLISLSDYFSFKPRSTDEKADEWDHLKLLENLSNREDFPIKLLNPGNSSGHASLGFHSDDASFVTNCCTAERKVGGSIHRVPSLAWLAQGRAIGKSIDKNGVFTCGVGFDGANVFIIHPNGAKLCVESFMAMDSWKSGSTFVPILMLGNCKGGSDDVQNFSLNTPCIDGSDSLLSVEITASIDQRLKEILK